MAAQPKRFTFLAAIPSANSFRKVTTIATSETAARARFSGLRLVFASRTPAGGAQ